MQGTSRLTSLVLCVLLGMGCSSSPRLAPDGFQGTWRCNQRSDDLWLDLSTPSGPLVAARLAAGGAIGELRAATSGMPLLSAPFRDEATDRVIQWTLWSHDLRHVVPGLPDFEQRANITQGGDFAGVLAPLMAVEPRIDGADVYGVARAQWKAELQGPLDTSIAMLTSYRPGKHGALLIRRVLLAGPALAEGRPATLGNCYLEAWTPFARAAFSGASLGQPISPAPDWTADHWPTYPGIARSWWARIGLASGWTGWVALHPASDGPAVGVAISPERGDAQRTELNAMAWDTGLGVLPGWHLRLDPGDLIEVEMALVVRPHLDDAMASALADLAQTLPPPRIVRAGDSGGATLDAERQRLAAVLAEAGVRTQHMGALLSPR